MKKLHTLFLISNVFIFAFVKGVFSDTWHEDFSIKGLYSWKIHDEFIGEFIWQTKDDQLDVWIDPFPGPGIFHIFPLEFVGFPIKVTEFDVKVSILEARGGSIGIFVGQCDDGDVYNRTIKFLHTLFLNTIIRRGADIDQLPPLVLVNNVPIPLKEIEVSFKEGHFSFFSQRILITEFQVKELREIDCFGLIAYVYKGAGAVGEFVLDDFIVSGPDVPVFRDLSVRPVGKAAVLWGDLKQR
ncbi:hypothetical protein F4X73_12620 [Candidatus Poribacteria bacterium]|nr:hypothetical protein [Candidatus Poribacteria bacterium]MYB65527.1 hypothetical protein [Candidatus Poribacteria bacterium]MYF55928.1 hypothetical protein [Candidatus Poribacteria bacterium]